MYKWIILNHIKAESFGVWVTSFYSVESQVNNAINWTIYLRGIVYKSDRWHKGFFAEFFDAHL